MDMRKHLPNSRWITNADLERRGGEYNGTIRSVTAKMLRNTYTKENQVQPVIRFEDDYELVPNKTMRTELIEHFGWESDSWIGQHLTIVLRMAKRLDSSTSGVRATKHLVWDTAPDGDRLDAFNVGDEDVRNVPDVDPFENEFDGHEDDAAGEDDDFDRHPTTGRRRR